MWLSESIVKRLGFRTVGKGVQIDSDATFSHPEFIDLGSFCRIDAQSMLLAGPDGISVGRGTHLGVGTLLFGGGGSIVFEEGAGCSPRVTIYTETDSFTAGFPRGPTVPSHLRRTRKGSVRIETHAGLGTGVIVLPGVTVGRYSAIACNVVLRRNVKPETSVVPSTVNETMEAKGLLEMHKNAAALAAYYDERERELS